MVRNKELTREVWKSRKQGRPTERLGVMIMEIAQSVGGRANWRNYTWREDAESQAMVKIIHGLMHNYDIRKGNPHGYCYTIGGNVFRTMVVKEKKHSELPARLAEGMVLEEERDFDPLDMAIIREELQGELSCAEDSIMDEEGLPHLDTLQNAVNY